MSKKPSDTSSSLTPVPTTPVTEVFYVGVYFPAAPVPAAPVPAAPVETTLTINPIASFQPVSTGSEAPNSPPTTPIPANANAVLNLIGQSDGSNVGILSKTQFSELTSVLKPITSLPEYPEEKVFYFEIQKKGTDMSVTGNMWEFNESPSTASPSASTSTPAPATAPTQQKQKDKWFQLQDLTTSVLRSCAEINDLRFYSEKTSAFTPFLYLSNDVEFYNSIPMPITKSEYVFYYSVYKGIPHSSVIKLQKYHEYTKTKLGKNVQGSMLFLFITTGEISVTDLTEANKKPDRHTICITSKTDAEVLKDLEDAVSSSKYSKEVVDYILNDADKKKYESTENVVAFIQTFLTRDISIENKTVKKMVETRVSQDLETVIGTIATENLKNIGEMVNSILTDINNCTNTGSTILTSGKSDPSSTDAISTAIAFSSTVSPVITSTSNRVGGALTAGGPTPIQYILNDMKKIPLNRSLKSTNNRVFQQAKRVLYVFAKLPVVFEILRTIKKFGCKFIENPTSTYSFFHNEGFDSILGSILRKSPTYDSKKNDPNNPNYINYRAINFQERIDQVKDALIRLINFDLPIEDMKTISNVLIIVGSIMHLISLRVIGGSGNGTFARRRTTTTKTRRIIHNHTHRRTQRHPVT
jgi:hypothetical protein